MENFKVPKAEQKPIQSVTDVQVALDAVTRDVAAINLAVMKLERTSRYASHVAAYSHLSLSLREFLDRVALISLDRLAGVSSRD